MAELYYFGEKVSPQFYIRNMILSNDGVRTYVRVSDMHNLLDKLSLPYSKMTQETICLIFCWKILMIGSLLLKNLKSV